MRKKYYESADLTPFAQFISSLKGYVFYKGARIVDRWELFEAGYSTEDCLSGKNGIAATRSDYPTQRNFLE